MNRVAKVIFIFFVSMRVAFGQSIDTADNNFCFKIAPLALLDIYSGMSPRVGVEYKLHNTLALYNELGTYISGPNSIQANRGVLIKIELKKYFNYSGHTTGDYISTELFYKHQSFRTVDSISVNTKYEKEYGVVKDVGCLTVKYGRLSVFKYNVIVDVFVGLGLRYKVSHSTLTEVENEHIVPIGDYHLNIPVSQAGAFFYPNIDLGVKIGYRIK